MLLSGSVSFYEIWKSTFSPSPLRRLRLPVQLLPSSSLTWISRFFRNRYRSETGSTRIQLYDLTCQFVLIFLIPIYSTYSYFSFCAAPQLLLVSLPSFQIPSPLLRIMKTTLQQGAILQPEPFLSLITSETKQSCTLITEHHHLNS